MLAVPLHHWEVLFTPLKRRRPLFLDKYQDRCGLWHHRHRRWYNFLRPSTTTVDHLFLFDPDLTKNIRKKNGYHQFSLNFPVQNTSILLTPIPPYHNQLERSLFHLSHHQWKRSPLVAPILVVVTCFLQPYTPEVWFAALTSRGALEWSPFRFFEEIDAQLDVW